MKFVANLREETIEAFAAESIQPAAYLLSSHRVSRASLEAASSVRKLGLRLFADNGTKPLIEDTVDHFSVSAAQIRSAIKELRRTLGHSPRGSEIPKQLRMEASRLAHEVVAHATKLSEAISAMQLLETQLSIRPTDLIAQEDFATACLTAINLEREITGWPVARFDERNRRSLRLWRRIADEPSCEGIRVYAVLSATDYNTARSAGRIAASEGVAHAAMGIASVTIDPSATDFFVLGQASFKLDRPAPRRYVRLAQILRGIADGYGLAGGHLKSFHCLGLGGPSLFSIPPAALPFETSLTTDATSPIQDAVKNRVFYDSEDNGNRVSTLEAVNRILHGGEWGFRNPFSAAFRDAHGHDPERARSWWRAQEERTVTSLDLEIASDLTSALPLFCEADTELRTLALRCRIASNHWVLDDLTKRIPDGKRRRELALNELGNPSKDRPTVTTRGLNAARSVLLSGVIA